MAIIIFLGQFLLFAWFITFICARKDYPIWMGILISVFLLPMGWVIVGDLTMLNSGRLWHPIATEFELFIQPALGAVLPIGIASLLPPLSDRGRECPTAPCGNCGRVNAVNSLVCPRCGHRSMDR